MAGVDPAFASLLANPRVALRPPPSSLPLAGFRQAADGFLARVRGPDVAAVEDFGPERTGLAGRLRLYRPGTAAGLPVILFVHGGGFVFGTLDTHDAMCRSLAVASGAAVLAVEYRLAPEHPHPAAEEDVAAALRWLAMAKLGLDAARVALVGDSAGAYLALATALRYGSLRHLALLYPVADPLLRSASAHDLGEGYMLTRGFLEWSWRCYAGARALDDPALDLAGHDLSVLPPTTIVTAEFDPLRDEGEALAVGIAAAGVAVGCRRFPGMIHGFAGLPQLTPTAGEALDHVGRRLAASLAR